MNQKWCKFAEAFSWNIICSCLIALTLLQLPDGNNNNRYQHNLQKIILQQVEKIPSAIIHSAIPKVDGTAMQTTCMRTYGGKPTRKEGACLPQDVQDDEKLRQHLLGAALKRVVCCGVPIVASRPFTCS